MNTNHILTLFLLVIAAGAVINSAWGHDIYMDWRMPDNPAASCCHDRDCRAVRASSDIEGNWTVHIAGQPPIPVPRSKILKMRSPDGRSHWCGQGMTTYCFVPGETRS